MSRRFSSIPSPGDELRSMRHLLQAMLAEAEEHPATLEPSRSDWVPAMEISEDEDGFLVTAELPEVRKKDLEVAVDRGVLTISGERCHKSKTKDRKRKFHLVERSYGRCSRSFRLPDEVDADRIKVKFKKGVLTVRLPRSEKKKSRRIEVR